MSAWQRQGYELKHETMATLTRWVKAVRELDPSITPPANNVEAMSYWLLDNLEILLQHHPQAADAANEVFALHKRLQTYIRISNEDLSRDDHVADA